MLHVPHVQPCGDVVRHAIQHMQQTHHVDKRVVVGFQDVPERKRLINVNKTGLNNLLLDSTRVLHAAPGT